MEAMKITEVDPIPASNKMIDKTSADSLQQLNYYLTARIFCSTLKVQVFRRTEECVPETEESRDQVYLRVRTGDATQNAHLPYDIGVLVPNAYSLHSVVLLPEPIAVQLR